MSSLERPLQSESGSQPPDAGRSVPDKPQEQVTIEKVWAKYEQIERYAAEIEGVLDEMAHASVRMRKEKQPEITQEQIDVLHQQAMLFLKELLEKLKLESRIPAILEGYQSFFDEYAKRMPGFPVEQAMSHMTGMVDQLKSFSPSFTPEQQRLLEGLSDARLDPEWHDSLELMARLFEPLKNFVLALGDMAEFKRMVEESKDPDLKQQFGQVQADLDEIRRKVMDMPNTGLFIQYAGYIERDMSKQEHDSLDLPVEPQAAPPRIDVDAELSASGVAFRQGYEKSEEVWIAQEPERAPSFVSSVVDGQVSAHLKDSAQKPDAYEQFSVQGLQKLPEFETWEKFIQAAGFTGSEYELIKQTISVYVVENFYMRNGEDQKKTEEFLRSQILPRAQVMMSMFCHIKNMYNLSPTQIFSVLGQAKKREMVSNAQINPHELAVYFVQNSEAAIKQDMENLYRFFGKLQQDDKVALSQSIPKAAAKASSGSLREGSSFTRTAEAYEKEGLKGVGGEMLAALLELVTFLSDKLMPLLKDLFDEKRAQADKKSEKTDAKDAGTGNPEFDKVLSMSKTEMTSQMQSDLVPLIKEKCPGVTVTIQEGDLMVLIMLEMAQAGVKNGTFISWSDFFKRSVEDVRSKDTIAAYKDCTGSVTLSELFLGKALAQHLSLFGGAVAKAQFDDQKLKSLVEKVDLVRYAREIKQYNWFAFQGAVEVFFTSLNFNQRFKEWAHFVLASNDKNPTFTPFDVALLEKIQVPQGQIFDQTWLQAGYTDWQKSHQNQPVHQFLKSLTSSGTVS